MHHPVSDSDRGKNHKAYTAAARDVVATRLSVKGWEASPPPFDVGPNTHISRSLVILLSQNAQRLLFHLLCLSCGFVET